MEKKKTIIFLMTLVLLIGGIYFVNNIYQNKNKINKTKRRKQNNLAIMIKEENASDYTKSSSNDIPIGNYILNEDKTHCENNGKILSYDNTTGKVKFSFVGSDRCYLYFDYYNEPRIGYEAILLDNSNGAISVEDAKSYIEEKGTPDFNEIADTNEGMFAYEEDGGKTYYFRGAIDNNWVKFGKFKEDFIMYRGYYDENSTDDYIDYQTMDDCTTGVNEELYESGYNYNCHEIKYASKNEDMYWRIIRIDKDNKIRLIYAGNTAPNINQKIMLTGEKSTMGTISYNTNYNQSEYVGFQYTIGLQRQDTTKEVNDSTIKTYLDNWYLKYFNSNKVGLITTTFCNDRNVTGYNNITWNSNTTSYSYDAYWRLRSVKPKPSLKCNENDNFTNNIGLLTADEILLSGILEADKFKKNNNHFLIIDHYYWTATPAGYIVQESNTVDGAEVYAFSSDGIFEEVTTYNYLPVKGVITLSAEVKLTGKGTWDNVYEVQ